MKRMALCAGLDVTMGLRGCKAFYTLMRCTILVKDKYADLLAPRGINTGRSFLVQ